MHHVNNIRVFDLNRNLLLDGFGEITDGLNGVIFGALADHNVHSKPKPVSAILHCPRP